MNRIERAKRRIAISRASPAYEALVDAMKEYSRVNQEMAGIEAATNALLPSIVSIIATAPTIDTKKQAMKTHKLAKSFIGSTKKSKRQWDRAWKDFLYYYGKETGTPIEGQFMRKLLDGRGFKFDFL